MKQLISDWLLARKPEPGVQNSAPSPVFIGIHREAKLLSDEGKPLLLTHLYLELRLTLEHALRAARADLSMAAKVQNHRRWVEQRGKVISNQESVVGNWWLMGGRGFLTMKWSNRIAQGF